MDSDPVYELKVVVNKEKEYKFTLQKDPLFYDLKKTRRTIIDSVTVIPLTPSDKIDFQLTSIVTKDSKEWKDLTAEEFVLKTNAGKTDEGCVFISTNTRFDNWDHKELYFTGLAMKITEYPSDK